MIHRLPAWQMLCFFYSLWTFLYRAHKEDFHQATCALIFLWAALMILTHLTQCEN